MEEQKRKRGRPRKPDSERGSTESFYATPECSKKLAACREQMEKTEGEIICEALTLYVKKHKVTVAR